MDPLKTLKVGVVGIGRIGRQHALNLVHHTPRATLVCACSPAEADLAWGKENLVPYGVQVFATFEEMIETAGLEAVVIASISHLHMAHTLAALDRGIHILCEKPVCTSIPEVSFSTHAICLGIWANARLKLRDLITRIEAKPQAQCMVGFVRRFDDSYREASLKVKQGQIGVPTVIRSQACERVDTSPFFRQYLRNSGGIFVDAIIHDIDLALVFFGEHSLPKSVAAMGTTTVHTELAEQGDADNAVGICEFWDGKIAFFYNSRMAAHGYDNVTEVFGTEGKLSINLVPRKNRVEVCDSDGYVKVEPTPSWYDRYEDAFKIEMNSWVNAVLDGQPMPVPLRSSLTGLVIATALQESLATGRKIFFDERGARVDNQT
ncbi:hypothetical protein ACKLNR_014089 [Fusarium oxysporum f. sp. zingiberi]